MGKCVGGKGVRFLFGKFVVIALLGSGILRSNSITRKGSRFLKNLWCCIGGRV